MNRIREVTERSLRATGKPREPERLGQKIGRETPIFQEPDPVLSVALKHGRFQIRLKHLFLLQVVLGLPLALAVLCAQLIERGRLSSAERDRQFRALESVGFAKDDDGEIRLLSPNENCTDGNLRLLIPFAEESNYVSGARP